MMTRRLNEEDYDQYSDLFRMILNEVIVYTITICIMLQLILGAKQNSDDLQMGFNIASFIVAVLWKTASCLRSMHFCDRTIFPCFVKDS